MKNKGQVFALDAPVCSKWALCLDLIFCSCSTVDICTDLILQNSCCLEIYACAMTQVQKPVTT